MSKFEYRTFWDRIEQLLKETEKLSSVLIKLLL